MKLSHTNTASIKLTCRAQDEHWNISCDGEWILDTINSFKANSMTPELRNFRWVNIYLIIAVLNHLLVLASNIYFYLCRKTRLSNSFPLNFFYIRFSIHNITTNIFFYLLPSWCWSFPVFHCYDSILVFSTFPQTSARYIEFWCSNIGNDGTCITVSLNYSSCANKHLNDFRCGC